MRNARRRILLPKDTAPGAKAQPTISIGGGLLPK
jgi:hypothetical protein